MNKLFGRIEREIILYALAVFGVLLIVIPQHLVKIVPYVLGVGLMLYACVNIFLIVRSGDREAKPGRNLVYLVVGLVSVLQRHNALGTIGVLWAMLTLMDCAGEINEFYETRQLHVFPMLWMVVSIVLAFMLMHDPMEHFVFHMRILGAEIIAHAFMRWRGLQAT